MFPWIKDTFFSPSPSPSFPTRNPCYTTQWIRIANMETNPSIPHSLAPFFQEYHLPAIDLAKHATPAIERSLL